ncbi:MAG: CocE/NonD family hydrolase [Dehalococcoidia bacterium]|nr:CocE/NonD family hydrolase [Dehalococcoidia bacterium]MSQ16197.1 CocE/NonD family hydrolase [Dehalococcoidia bacterium]
MPQPKDYKVLRDHNVMVPMRDGTRLAADVFRPDAPGRFPVLVTRGPYGKDGYVANPDHSVWFFSKHGYVVVIQDCRGRFESEGVYYEPLFQEANDGYDTVEWAARQSWSNGRVGTTGQSYLGATQYTLATSNPLPPHLQAMAPVSASSDFHQSWVYHTGGAMEWGWMVPYAIHKGRNTLERLGRTDLLARMDEYVLPAGNFGQPLKDQWYRHLPLRDWVDWLKETAPYFGEYFQNETDGPYWSRINLLRNLEGVKIPMFHVSSWYDIFLEGALNAYQAIRANGGSEQARRSQKLLVGPWAHIRPYTSPNSGGAGDIDFGPEASIELHQFLLRWFDYWLKDMETGIMDEPPVSLFVMGENHWRQEWEWPLARTHYTRYYCHSQGQANSRHGDGGLSTVPPDAEPVDTYIYNPNDPVPTRCGNTLMIPHGVADQRPTEDRPDVLVYTSEPLERALELTGPIQVCLYAASSAVDTDFTAKLVDVRPDGYAQNLQDGIVRARYRSSATQASFIRPGQVYEYTIDLWSTSHVLFAGHRLRVEIASSNFPRFDRNPNTGAPLGQDARVELAQQTVHHSAAYPSHIVLPVIPR